MRRNTISVLVFMALMMGRNLYSGIQFSLLQRFLSPAWETIEYVDAVGQFAGCLVAYEPTFESRGTHSQNFPEEKKHSYQLAENPGCFYGYVLREPVIGKDEFYRMLPFLHASGANFVRDFGPHFLDNCKTLRMREVTSDERAKLRLALLAHEMRFFLKNFRRASRTGCDPTKEELEKVFRPR